MHERLIRSASGLKIDSESLNLTRDAGGGFLTQLYLSLNIYFRGVITLPLRFKNMNRFGGAEGRVDKETLPAAREGKKYILDCTSNWK
jgi:hypothetical protein